MREVRQFTQVDLSVLSIREREVYDLLMIGSVRKEIAATLGIAVKTTDIHIGNVYKKTGLGCAGLMAEQARREAEEEAESRESATDESLEQAERSIADGLEKIREARGRLTGRSLRTATTCSFSFAAVAVMWMWLGGATTRTSTDQHKEISTPTKIVVNVGKEGEILAVASIKKKIIHRIRPDGLNGHAEGIYPENLREFRSEAEIERAIEKEGYRMTK